MKDKTSRQMSESLLIGVLLTLTGGYFDAYTFIERGGVFANAQTGNIVLLGISLARGDYGRVLLYLIPIVSFVLGVIVAELIRTKAKNKIIHWRQTVLIIELFVICIVSVFPAAQEKGNYYDYNMVSNVLISFICAVQVQSFRRINGIVCATTMCTGNLRSGTDSLMKYSRTKNKTDLHTALNFYFIDFVFVVGAVISVFVTSLLHEKALLPCGALVIAALLIMFSRPKDETEPDKEYTD